MLYASGLSMKDRADFVNIARDTLNGTEKAAPGARDEQGHNHHHAQSDELVGHTCEVEQGPKDFIAGQSGASGP